MQQPLSWRKGAHLVLIGWLAMIGFDFFWHAGLLAGLYARPSPFLLAPERAFALIPVGYLSFLLLSVLLVWLAARVEVQSGREGALFGLKLGALAWGALVLGLFSIATASPLLLGAWFVGQTLELGIAGALVGRGLQGARLRGLYGRALLLLVVAVVASVVLQNVGTFFG